MFLFYCLSFRSPITDLDWKGTGFPFRKSIFRFCNFGVRKCFLSSDNAKLNCANLISSVWLLCTGDSAWSLHCREKTQNATMPYHTKSALNFAPCCRLISKVRYKQQTCMFNFSRCVDSQWIHYFIISLIHALWLVNFRALYSRTAH